MVSFRRLLERRWLVLPLSVTMGLVSAFLLWVTLRSVYWDYWLVPKLKAADPGLYIYPELRYAFFDIVLLMWCLDGLVAASLSSWSAVTSRTMSAWAYRTIIVYSLLLAVLILGGSLMFFVRSRGY
jgi:hypothetical protein